MPLRDQRLLVLSAAIASIALLASAALGQEELVAYAVPLLVLALPLLARASAQRPPPAGAFA